jgi:hypothetical protein
MDEGLGFGSLNQLGDFWGKIKMKAYFLGEEEDHVWISWKENLGRGTLFSK